MTKRCVTQIVCETNALDQVFISTQGTRQRPADLGNFERVGEAGAEVIAFVIDEDLRLVLETSKSRGVQDAVAIALKSSAIFGFIIQIRAPFGVSAARAIRCKAFVLDLFEMLAGEVHVAAFQMQMSLRPSTTGFRCSPALALGASVASQPSAQDDRNDMLEWGERGSNPHGVATDEFKSVASADSAIA